MERTLLKNGYVVDGSGKKGFVGSVALEGDKIAAVSRKPVPEEGFRVIDCAGKVISPGFIDAHSHLDRNIFYQNERQMVEPFIRQGIATFVTGNCGVGVAGIEKGSPFMEALIPDPNTKDPKGKMLFHTYEDFFNHLQEYGMRQNMAFMAPHGVAAGSVVGMENPLPITPEIEKRIERLQAEALDTGCKGISFGLGYRPDNFFTDEEIRRSCDVAIRRNKLITVHERVMSLTKPYVPGGEEPENVKWTREFVELFRGSGAKLQLSHLLFVGRTAFTSFEPMMEMFDREVEESGVDLWFDMYSYVQGVSSIQVLLPVPFFKMIPGIYENKPMLAQMAAMMMDAYGKIGIMPADVQLCDGMSEEYTPYNGMFMDQIMKERGVNVAELYTDLYRRSHGFARIYFYVEQDERTIPLEMTNPRALYMTDAYYVPGCHQNQAAYNTMPKFLRLARETGNQTLEETIAKMTGRSADRFDLPKRGYLREGNYADVVVFDYENITDTSTPEKPDSEPIGIEHLFVNGSHILEKGALDPDSRKGMLII